MRKSVSMGLMAGVLGMSVANAEIKVDDKLSLSGFIDMSISGSSSDAGDALDATFDQFEISLGYKFSDKLSAKVDLSQGGTSLTNAALSVEEANVTYSTGALSLTTGRFLSSTGWEAAEPTGLYQYSYSIYCDAPCIYGGYQNGVALSYTVSPMISLYASVFGSAAGIAQTGVDAGGSTSLKEPGFEGQISLMPVEGVTAKVAYLFDDQGAYNYTLINAWASYATGPITAAVEFNVIGNATADGDDGIGYLAMLNYKLTDKIAGTVRYSAVDLDISEKDSEIALAPSYALADNWLAVAEVRRTFDSKVTSYAIESLVTF